MIRRATPGGKTSVSIHSNTDTNIWLKLSRRGEILTGAVSGDAASWHTLEESIDVELPERVYVGLVGTTRDRRGPIRIPFSQVTLSSPGRQREESRGHEE